MQYNAKILKVKKLHNSFCPGFFISFVGIVEHPQETVFFRIARNNKEDGISQKRQVDRYL